MTKPVCVNCGLFYRIVKNGAVIEEGMPLTSDSHPGEGVWGPYKLHRADHWRCNGCGAELALTARLAFSEHYMEDYEEEKRRHPPLVFVKDC